MKEREDDAHDYLEIEPPRRRRPRRRRRVYRPPWPWGRLLLVAGVALALSGGVWAFRALRREPHAVMLGAQVLVVAASKQDAETFVEDLRRRHAKSAPRIVSFREGMVTVAPYRGGQPPLEGGAAIDALDRHLTAVMDGAAINVAGQTLVMLATDEDASQALGLALERGAVGKTGVPTFKERIYIVGRTQTEGDTNALPIMTPAEAAEFLVHPPVPHVYEIKRGDSFWSVANAHGITVDQLRGLNPGVNPGTLNPGDKIKLPDDPSPITVVVK